MAQACRTGGDQDQVSRHGVRASDRAVDDDVACALSCADTGVWRPRARRESLTQHVPCMWCVESRSKSKRYIGTVSA
eukprot:7384784-Prymnesium_polylepis.3